MKEGIHQVSEPVSTPDPRPLQDCKVAHRFAKNIMAIAVLISSYIYAFALELLPTACFFEPNSFKDCPAKVPTPLSAGYSPQILDPGHTRETN